VTKKWNSIPEFHWNNFFFSGIWKHLKSGISGKMPKKWNFGPFFYFPEYRNYLKVTAAVIPEKII